MNNLTRLIIFLIGACGLLSLAKASSPKNYKCPTSPKKTPCSTKPPLCPTVNCFDCSKCNQDCNKVAQECDTVEMVQVRRMLCNLENANCMKKRGCNEEAVSVSVYPAMNYDISQPQYIPKEFQVRRNCCYTLTDIYDNTLSGITNPNGVCVQLFDGADCTGDSVIYNGRNGTGTEACLKWIDCSQRLNAGGIIFNDRTSSFKLC